MTDYCHKDLRLFEKIDIPGKRYLHCIMHVPVHVIISVLPKTTCLEENRFLWSVAWLFKTLVPQVLHVSTPSDT